MDGKRPRSAAGTPDPFDCPICMDTGWVSQDKPVGHPDFGKLLRCECKEAEDSVTAVQRRYTYSELPNRFRSSRFSSFDVRGRDPSIKIALDTAMNFARGNTGSKFLVLAGAMGTGKTHLGSAILIDRIEQLGNENIGKYASVPVMLQQLRDGYSDGSYRQSLDVLRDAPLLFLDDLGAEYQRGDSVTTWAGEQLYLLINDRYVREAELVVTTNVPSEQLEPRIIDRLVHTADGFSTVVSMKGKSYRRNESGTGTGRSAKG